MAWRSWLGGYPWDWLDHDDDRPLESLRNEIGADGLSVRAAFPSLRRLLRRGDEHRLLRTSGGCFFRPDRSRYATVGVFPPVNVRGVKTDPMGRMVRACAERGVLLRMQVSFSAFGRLSRKYLGLATVNVLGLSSRSSICPSNPKTQDFLSVMLRELIERYSPDAVLLADLAAYWREAGHPDLQCEFELSDDRRRLLSLCWCDSCRSSAAGKGFDADRLGRLTRNLLTRRFGAGASREENELPSEIEPALAEHRSWRSKMLAALLRRLRSDCGDRLILQRTGISDEQISPGDVPAQMPVLESFPSAGETEKEHATRGSSAELLLAANQINRLASHQLVHLVSQAGSAGYRGVLFDDYDMLNEESRNAVRQAVRFSRRESRH